MSLFKNSLLVFAWLCIMAGPTHAAGLTVACAANFTSPMKKLAALYQKETNTQVTCTFGSTGMLYGQIIKGAPYDLFFAADEKRPTRLFEAKLSEKPALYAKGKVVLWTKKEQLASASNWIEAVSTPEIKRVGIANPKTAPYGLRAKEAMANAGLTGPITPKLAFGKNVGMAFQFAYSGAAEVSFVALSQAFSEKGASGTYWPVPEAGMVNQAACVLKKGNTEEAIAFLVWLATPSAKNIIMSYGYD